jgi:hypothetical protein
LENDEGELRAGGFSRARRKKWTDEKITKASAIVGSYLRFAFFINYIVGEYKLEEKDVFSEKFWHSFRHCEEEVAKIRKLIAQEAEKYKDIK